MATVDSPLDLPPADRIDTPPAALRGLTWHALLLTAAAGFGLGLLCALLLGLVWPPLAPAALLGLPLLWVWAVSGLALRLTGGMPRRVAIRLLLRRLGALSGHRWLQPPAQPRACRYVPRRLPQ